MFDIESYYAPLNCYCNAMTVGWMVCGGGGGGGRALEGQNNIFF